jgi:Predicted transcriptional regulator, contains C-terminal CBS domains
MKWNSAKDLMTTDVKTVEADWPLDRVAQFLIDHGISGAPVVDDDKLMGVISLTDIARHNSTGGDPASEQPTAYYRHELEAQYSEEDLDNLRVTEGDTTTAKHVMTPQVYNVKQRTPIQQVARVMHRGGIHRVFVTENGEIRGIITAMDMLQVVAEEL